MKERLTTRVTVCARPHEFVDQQASGPFAYFTHRHQFRELQGGTLMVDDFDYGAPLGVFGRLADRLFLERYMRHLLVERARVIKSLAESKARLQPAYPPGNWLQLLRTWGAARMLNW